MIIRPNGSSRLAITQPDHAALAAHIVKSWRANGLSESPRRNEILLAIAEHDNGWREVDDRLLVDPATGAIQDFATASGEIRRGVWPRAVARLSATPYAAALVAHHAAHVYGRFRGDPDWMYFFDEMEAARDRHLHALGIARAELLNDYVFLRIGDLASLMFCTGVTMAGEFGYSARLEDGEQLVITPDPFGGADIPLSIDAREIEGYSLARRVTVTGIARGTRTR
jgi:Protein of unknown function (DUF3891)